MTLATSVRSRFLSRLTGLARVSKCLPAFALFALSGLFFTIPALAQTTTADAPSYAGFWNKPSEAGWGLNLQQQGDNIFAAWYTYDADGKPTWLSMSCKLIGSQCKDSIYATTGRPLSQGLTNIGVNVSNVGIGSFTFNTTSNLTFTYTLYGKTKTISDVTKFNFAPADQVPVCTQTNASRTNVTNYTDTWWGGAAASGWGLSLSHQGDNIFVAMYTYSDDIKPAWATGLVTKVAGTTATYRGDFSAPRSGTPFFDIDGSNATTFPLPKTGTFTLTFTSGEAATLEYDLAVAGAATSSKGRVALSRLAVATGATTSCGDSGVTPPTGSLLPKATAVDIEACPAAEFYEFNKNWYTICMIGKRFVGKDKDTGQACELRLYANKTVEYARDGVVVVSNPPLPESLVDTKFPNYINLLDPKTKIRIFEATAGTANTIRASNVGYGFGILIYIDRASPDGAVTNLRLASISRTLGNALVCQLDPL